MVVLAARSAAAQEATPPAGRVLLAGGVDAVLFDGGRQQPGFTLHAGYERRIGRGPFAWRIAGDFWRQSDRLDGASYETRDAIAGASLLTSYTFKRNARLRPYVLAGAGVSRMSQRLRGTLAVQNGLGITQPVEVVAASPRTSAAFSGGLGLESAIGGRGSVFLESRVTYLPGGRARHDRASIRGLLAPVVLGVRF